MRHHGGTIPDYNSDSVMCEPLHYDAISFNFANVTTIANPPITIEQIVITKYDMNNGSNIAINANINNPIQACCIVIINSILMLIGGSGGI